MRSKEFKVNGIDVTVSTGRDNEGKPAVIISAPLHNGAEIKHELRLNLEQEIDLVFEEIDLFFVERWVTILASSPLASRLKGGSGEVRA